MERDTFEVALSVALDALPPNAIITHLNYDSHQEDAVCVSWALVGERGTCICEPLVVSLGAEPSRAGCASGLPLN